MTAVTYTDADHAAFVARLKGDIAMFEKSIPATEAVIASPEFATWPARKQASYKHGLANAQEHLKAKRRHLAGAT